MGRSIEQMVNRQILRWLQEKKSSDYRWVSESTDAQVPSRQKNRERKE